MNRAARLLAQSVERLMDARRYREALAFRSRFHAYSLRNAWLIYHQRPDATLVAGYRRWQQLGRQVKRGEKALAILAPLVRTVEENGERERRVVGFRTAAVFGIEQTQGEPVPVPPQPEILAGGGKRVERLAARLEAFAVAAGLQVERRALPGARLGCFSPASGRIEVRDDLPPLQALKTLTHEVAHALMHREGDTARHVAELEAESCAFLVCHALGLDTSRYTFAYLAAWASDPGEILPAAERADQVAREVLERIEGEGADAPSPLLPYDLRPTQALSTARAVGILGSRPSETSQGSPMPRPQPDPPPPRSLAR